MCTSRLDQYYVDVNDGHATVSHRYAPTGTTTEVTASIKMPVETAIRLFRDLSRQHRATMLDPCDVA